MNQTQLWTPAPEVSAQLSNPQNFSRAVKAPSASTKALSTVGIIALALLVYNLVNTITSLNKNGLSSKYFVDMFFTVESYSGSVNPILVLQVWGPILAIPLIVVLLIISLSTKDARARKVFEAYQSGGYIAVANTLPLAVVSGRVSYTPLVLLSPLADANLSADWYINQVKHIEGLTSKEKKILAKDFGRQVKSAAKLPEMRTVFQHAPAEMFLTFVAATKEQSRLYVVLPTQSGRTALPVKVQSLG